MKHQNSFLPVILMTLAAISTFPIKGQEQPTLPEIKPEAMTQQELDRVQASDDYQILHAERNMVLDFGRGLRYQYPDQGLTLFMLPVVDRIPSKVAYFLEEGDKRAGFVLEILPADRQGRTFTVAISDALQQNHMKLSYEESGKLQKMELQGELANQKTQLSSTKFVGRAFFPPPNFNFWRFFYCLADNGIVPGISACARCVYLIAVVLYEGGEGEDQAQSACYICAVSTPRIFPFCWAYASGR